MAKLLIIVLALEAIFTVANESKVIEKSILAVNGVGFQCPWEMRLDVSLERRPRVIRELRCVEVEAAGAGEAVATLQRRGRCVQLYDRVDVQVGSHPTTYEVPIGCTFMFEQPSLAEDPAELIPY